MPPSSGRPCEFTHAKREELLNHIAQGASLAHAANIVRISLRTVQRAAETDDEFHHDLALAQHDAPVDPERQMIRAARAHWRAAAWMLERADPERFGKRPAKSCSPEKVQDLVAYLIEMALEAVPREHHEAIYRHMRYAADWACGVLLPDRQESRRFASAIATRPKPWTDALRGDLVLRGECSRAQDDSYAPPSPWGAPRHDMRPYSVELGDAPQDDAPPHGDEGDLAAPMSFNEMDTEEEVQACYDEMQKAVNATAVRSWRDQWRAEIDAKIAAEQSAAATSDSSDGARGESANEGEPLPAVGAPPDGGIMSPKTHSGEKWPATECDATNSAGSESPPRAQAA